MSSILSGMENADFYQMLVTIAQAEGGTNKAAERIASGMRINRASDDPAGLVISESLRQQLSGLTQAIRNTTDAVNVAGTADAGLAQAQDLVQNIRSTALRAANAATTDPEAVQAYNIELQYSLQALDRIAGTTQFGGRNLLDGSYTGQQIQIGPNSGQSAEMSLPDVSAEALGLSGIDVASAQTAAEALERADAACASLSETRAQVGAFTKDTLMSNIGSLEVARQNIAATESQIRDADMAVEVANLTKCGILKDQATAAMTHNSAGLRSLIEALTGK
jgi:flagellin